MASDAMILWRVYPLLDCDREVSSEIKAVARQQIFNKQHLKYNSRIAMFPTWSVLRGYKRDEV
jgi:hypothetical protein